MRIMQWLKGHKKEILKSLLLILIVGAMAGCGYGILRLCGFSSQEDFIRLRDDLGDSIWFWLVIAALQIFQVIFIPVSNQLVTVPCALCFQDELWKVFFTSWLSIWFATMILWAIGKFGGKKVLAWILGDKEQVDRCSKWLSRGWIFYPLGMLLPLPDDIVTVLAGTADFKFWFVGICSLCTRAIDIAFSVWGWGYLTKFWWGWIVLFGGTALLCVVTYFFYKIEKNREKEAVAKTESKN